MLYKTIFSKNSGKNFSFFVIQKNPSLRFIFVEKIKSKSTLNYNKLEKKKH